MWKICHLTLAVVCCCACGALQATPPSISAPPKAGSVKGAPASVKLRLLPQESSPEMSCIRCGTCHTLIMNDGDRNWHVVVMGHEEPYDDEEYDE